jgi:hypothetical protein
VKIYIPVMRNADSRDAESGPTSLFNTWDTYRHQPPSSLVSGWFFALFATVLLAIISLDVVTSRYVYDENCAIAARHEKLAHIRQQIDDFSGHLDDLSQALQASSPDEKQIVPISTDQDFSAMSSQFLPAIATELPQETADVQHGVAGLKSAWQAWRQSGRGPASMRRDGDLLAAAAHLEQAGHALRSGVDRLDDANLNRLTGLQTIRFWKNTSTTIAWLLILFALGYSARLYRRLRREEMARFNIESEHCRIGSRGQGAAACGAAESGPQSHA